MADEISSATSKQHTKRNYLEILYSMYHNFTRSWRAQDIPLDPRIVNLDVARVDESYLESLARQFVFIEIDRKRHLDLSRSEIIRISPVIKSVADEAVLEGRVADETMGHATWGRRFVHYKFKLMENGYKLRITHIS
jgi:hypothetical protein